MKHIHTCACMHFLVSSTPLCGIEWVSLSHASLSALHKQTMPRSNCADCAGEGGATTTKKRTRSEGEEEAGEGATATGKPAGSAGAAGAAADAPSSSTAAAAAAAAPSSTVNNASGVAAASTANTPASNKPKCVYGHACEGYVAFTGGGRGARACASMYVYHMHVHVIAAPGRVHSEWGENMSAKGLNSTAQLLLQSWGKSQPLNRGPWSAVGLSGNACMCAGRIGRQARDMARARGQEGRLGTPRRRRPLKRCVCAYAWCVCVMCMCVCVCVCVWGVCVMCVCVCVWCVVSVLCMCARM